MLLQREEERAGGGTVAGCLPSMSQVLGSSCSIMSKRQKGGLYGEIKSSPHRNRDGTACLNSGALFGSTV